MSDMYEQKICTRAAVESVQLAVSAFYGLSVSFMDAFTYIQYV